MTATAAVAVEAAAAATATATAAAAAAAPPPQENLVNGPQTRPQVGLNTNHGFFPQA